MVVVIAVAVTIDTALLELIALSFPEIERRTGASEEALSGPPRSLRPADRPSLAPPAPGGLGGAQGLLIAGLVLAAAGSGVIAASESIWPLVLGRVIQGVGSAASWIAALALVSDLARPGRRGRRSVPLGATSAGSTRGASTRGGHCRPDLVLRPLLIVGGISVAIAVAATFLLPPERRTASRTPAWATIRRSVGSGTGAVAVGMTIAGACALGLIEVVAPLDLDSRLGLSSAVIGLLFAWSMAVDAAVAPFGGRWGIGTADVARRVRLAATAGSALLLAGLGGTVGAALALGVFGAGFSLTFSAAVPWLDEAFGEVERGLGYGVLNLLYAAGYTIGPRSAAPCSRWRVPMRPTR